MTKINVIEKRVASDARTFYFCVIVKFARGRGSCEVDRNGFEHCFWYGHWRKCCPRQRETFSRNRCSLSVDVDNAVCTHVTWSLYRSPPALLHLSRISFATGTYAISKGKTSFGEKRIASATRSPDGTLEIDSLFKQKNTIFENKGVTLMK